jgi:hypothetical protein
MRELGADSSHTLCMREGHVQSSRSNSERRIAERHTCALVLHPIAMHRMLQRE